MASYPSPLIDALIEGGSGEGTNGMSTASSFPFRVLIATILSSRTKDTLTARVVPHLFAIAPTPMAMLELSEEQLAALIYPVGCYRNKARTIHQLCAILITRYAGAVPDELEELLTLPGVGRKTANLVITKGFGKPGICVDTHVHRICNRWGYVQTKTPHQTEFALRDRLPAEYWITFNRLLVKLGQHLCHPTSPRCGTCPVAPWCKRVGVVRSR